MHSNHIHVTPANTDSTAVTIDSATTAVAQSSFLVVYIVKPSHILLKHSSQYLLAVVVPVPSKQINSNQE
jgi:hypothetical protein